MPPPVAECCLVCALSCSPLGASIGAAQERLAISDPLIERALEGELWEARAVDANDIDVELTQGVATLIGTVDDIIAKERAVRIARMTRGVLSVVDRMTVRDSGRSDAVIEHDLQRAFVTDPATDSWEIATSVENGAVTITGAVQSAAERRLAERVAKTVAGVRSVDNRLAVETDATRTDPELKFEID
jgi:osmotically-inducible protein OsmY